MWAIMNVDDWLRSRRRWVRMNSRIVARLADESRRKDRRKGLWK